MRIEGSEQTPPVPEGFLGYLRGMGPGIVAVLTWFGAGDVVGAGVAGGNYGYALMWTMVVAVLMRYVLVSQVAKYQLCNPHGEGVLDGLARLHRAFPLALFVATLILGHVYGAYMLVGVGETSVQFTGWGSIWHWSLLWCAVSALLTMRGVYHWVEFVFKILLAVLAVCFIGTAAWIGPSPVGILKGTIGFELPETHGPYTALLVAVSMTGAVGGSLMNLAYPYFMEQKGWRGPAFRRLQQYDLQLSLLVMIGLNLAIWTLGAELIHRRGESIGDLAGLTELMGLTLGDAGRRVFILGVFAAVFTSLVGVAMGLGYIGSHSYLRWRTGSGPLGQDYRTHRLYPFIVVWVLVSPLIWTHPALANFVALTLVGNAVQMLILPVVAGGLWWITASRRFIGAGNENRWWQNLVMAILFALSLWGSWGAIRSVGGAFQELLGKPAP